MELTERITSRVTELTGEVELLRKQLADAEHELERLLIAGQVHGTSHLTAKAIYLLYPEPRTPGATSQYLRRVTMNW